MFTFGSAGQPDEIVISNYRIGGSNYVNVLFEFDIQFQNHRLRWLWMPEKISKSHELADKYQHNARFDCKIKLSRQTKFVSSL